MVESNEESSGAIDFRQQALGIGLVVLSAICIAIVPSLAKLAYDGGSNTLSVITGRSIVSVVITLALLLLLRRPIRIPLRPLAIGLTMGVGYAIILYGYLGAVNYLPVNQVILIYFIHPLLVGAIIMAFGQERLRPISGIALATALLGLGLAIGFSSSGTSVRGIGLASIAMVVTAFVIIGNARAISEAPTLSVGFYMMLSAALSLALLFAAFGALALPHSSLGWAGFIGVAFAATTGTLTFMGGMAYVGATRASMISNLEPVLGVLFAIAALGERVTLRQGLGITIVISSIFAMELDRYKRPI